MKAERNRVRRMRRLEMLRAHAKRAAAREAAEAEGTLSQLVGLVTRTEAIAAEYRGRTVQCSGYELRQTSQFLAGLGSIAQTTRNDAATARIHADGKQHDLALAERRRAAVEERVRSTERALVAASGDPALGSRRPVGTVLE